MPALPVDVEALGARLFDAVAGEALEAGSFVSMDGDGRIYKAALYPRARRRVLGVAVSTAEAAGQSCSVALSGSRLGGTGLASGAVAYLTAAPGEYSLGPVSPAVMLGVATSSAFVVSVVDPHPSIEWNSEPGTALATSDAVSDYRYQFFSGDEQPERTEVPGDYLQGMVSSVVVGDERIYSFTLSSGHSQFDGRTILVPVHRMDRGLPVALGAGAVIEIPQPTEHVFPDGTTEPIADGDFEHELNPVLIPLDAHKLLLSSVFRYRVDGTIIDLFGSTRVSDDRGRTWGTRRRQDFGASDGVGSDTWTVPTKAWWHDRFTGELVQLWYTYSAGGDYTLRAMATRNGLDWSFRANVMQGAGREYSEAAAMRFASGRIVVLARDDSTGEDPYTGLYTLAQAYSDDEGATWSDPVTGPVGNGYPSAMVLSDNTGVLVVRGAQPEGAGEGALEGVPTLYATSDEGATWTDGVAIGNVGGGFWMGGALEASPMPRVIMTQDIGSSIADNCGGYYVELRDDVFRAVEGWSPEDLAGLTGFWDFRSGGLVRDAGSVAGDFVLASGAAPTFGADGATFSGSEIVVSGDVTTAKGLHDGTGGAVFLRLKFAGLAAASEVLVATMNLSSATRGFGVYRTSSGQIKVSVSNGSAWVTNYTSTLTVGDEEVDMIVSVGAAGGTLQVGDLVESFSVSSPSTEDAASSLTFGRRPVNDDLSFAGSVKALALLDREVTSEDITNWRAWL